MEHKPAVEVVEFESRCIYEPQRPPYYACWACLFPGEHGRWYVAFEEVSRPEKPLSKSPAELTYAIGLPQGYDKSQFLMEAVIIESTDEMQSWHEVSRKGYRFHHTVGLYGGSGRTRNGKFLRFHWPVYCFDRSVKPNEILEVSEDDGKTWINKGSFHDAHFTGYPHRLRMLRDGTLVVCVPLWPRFGTSERPIRASCNPYAVGEYSMTLFFSFDQGQSWEGPLPIYAGQRVSETDFVELPSGDLLFINNSIFAIPGRQLIYRDGNHFTPGPLERARGNTCMPDGESINLNTVPEAVCLIDDGILVGCMRPGHYYFSDDLGQMWHPLPGSPQPKSVESLQVYQPSMCYLGDGKVACAGHLGFDDPITNTEDETRFIKRHNLHVHLFKVNNLRKTKETTILVERNRVEGFRRWPNSYTLTLLCESQPLPEKELEFWYAEQGRAGYDSFGKFTFEQRRELGGKRIKVRTDADGKAHVNLSHLDEVKHTHYSYQFVVLFNADGTDSNYKPAHSCHFEQYANWALDKPLE